jgi:hypothetical protein
MDPHAADALAHYEALIALRYPPMLAAALAAARYQTALAAHEQASLAAARNTVVAVGEHHPTLRRTAGQLLEKIDGEMGIATTVQRRNNRRS